LDIDQRVVGDQKEGKTKSGDCVRSIGVEEKRKGKEKRRELAPSSTTRYQDSKGKKREQKKRVLTSWTMFNPRRGERKRGKKPELNLSATDKPGGKEGKHFPSTLRKGKSRKEKEKEEGHGRGRGGKGRRSRKVVFSYRDSGGKKEKGKVGGRVTLLHSPFASDSGREGEWGESILLELQATKDGEKKKRKKGGMNQSIVETAEIGGKGKGGREERTAMAAVKKKRGGRKKGGNVVRLVFPAEGRTRKGTCARVN